MIFSTKREFSKKPPRRQQMKALARQFAQAMREQKVTKATPARRMKTSRAQLDRLLDPENESVTLRTLARAAEILGMRVQIELLDS